jgi:hypothetical protein
MASYEHTVEHAFEQFAAAISAKDEAAFRALHAQDAPAQISLFHRNSRKLADLGGVLQLKRAAETGDVAELLFDVLDASGTVVDRGRLTLSREPTGWRLQSM